MDSPWSSPTGAAAGPPSQFAAKMSAAMSAAARRRAARGAALNGALLLPLCAALCQPCAVRAPLHYVELALAALLAANLLAHLRRLLQSAPVTPAPPLLQPNKSSPGKAAEDAASLSPPRSWRVSPPPRASPPPSPTEPPPDPHTPDHFIADKEELASYLRRQAEAEAAALQPGDLSGGGASPGRGGRYRLAAAPAPPATPAPDHLAVWRRLRLDPQRLTQFNLNLRLWLHVTLLEPLARQLDRADAALAAAGDSLADAGDERLRALAGAGAADGALPALLPFLQTCPDRRYLARRVRELARGGCLSAYRWAGGGVGWHAGLPPDAELLLRLLAAYLDGQLPAPPARPFSSQCVVGPMAARGAALAVVRVSAAPPQYALALRGDVLAPPPGRNNLLHALLLLLAAAAQQEPPRLLRAHLGKAGLNMLWIIGR